MPRPERPTGVVVALLGTVALVAAACGSTASTHAPRTPASAKARPSTTARPAAVQASPAPWHLPSPVSREVVVDRGGRLVVLGGLDASGASASGVFSIDPSSGSVQRIGALTAPTHDAGGVILRGAIVVFGGGDSSVYATVQAFDPSTGAARVAGQLPSPRADLAALTMGGTAFVVGGYDGSKRLADVLSTTDGSSFKVVAQLAEPVRYPAVAAVGGAIYVFGGLQAGGERSGTYTTAIQRIDPSSGTARVVGQLPTPLAHASAAVLGGQIVVMGGRTAAGVSGAIQRYDPSSGTLTPAGQLPIPVADAGVATVAGTVYLVGGEASAPLDQVTVVRR